jgi:hypothetical protein
VGKRFDCLERSHSMAGFLGARLAVKMARPNVAMFYRWQHRLDQGAFLVGLCVTLSLTSCRTAGFKRVFAALDEQGNRKRTTFFADTTAIFCAGELVSGRTDVTVQATIRANELYDVRSDRLLPVRGIAWVGELAPGKTTGTVVSFKLLKTPNGGPEEDQLPYPVGTYTCELSIDGEPEDSVNFDIQFPACPVLPPTPDQSCAGWVRPGSQCEGAGARICSCAESGVWQCG